MASSAANGAVPNIALLIDADNSSAASLDEVLTVLAELGTVNVRRAYGHWSNPAPKGRVQMLHRHAIEPQQQRSEEHTSALQSLMRISYAVFCLKTKNANLLCP